MKSRGFVLGRLARGLCLLIISSALYLAAGSAPAAAATVQQQGYIPMTDGTQLEYTVELPAPTGRFPVALQYAGYCEGTNPSCNAPKSTPALLAAGYAVLGVSIRGTSCSTGTFNAFSQQEYSDGAAAVEWAARQPWSDGHVGMYAIRSPASCRSAWPGFARLIWTRSLPGR